ncbi:MAG: N-succinylarginine dihydrolase [Deltaproteobacteria bacterium]|nr:MAG: N-succinylarginine dihydrolase [Deltaproteobacteria bacterium]
MNPSPAPDTNFDGLVGPTHNYAGMARGNLASESHRGHTSSPRAAALQGLRKMAALIDLGIPQGILPPLERPNLSLLRHLGFAGTDDATVLKRAWKEAPELVVALSNASSMWTANAATVSPSAHCSDGRVHFTAANLAEKFHRATEAEDTASILRAAFHDPLHFAHHPPLFAHPALGDEGAANHMLLRTPDGRPGIEIFVHGRNGLGAEAAVPRRYPARQTRAASSAVARRHGIHEGRALLVRQNPEVIDEGVFHNDVIAVANDQVLLYHQDAFLDEAMLLEAARRALGGAFVPVRIERELLSVPDAVRSYLFNSQLVTLPDGSMALITPEECTSVPAAAEAIDWILAHDNPIRVTRSFDLRQSMQNGGGPACLRLRVPLTDDQRAAVHPGFLLDHERIARLESWVRTHYRDRLSPNDLGDPKLLDETRTALDELCTLLGAGSLYPFQRNG